MTVVTESANDEGAETISVVSGNMADEAIGKGVENLSLSAGSVDEAVPEEGEGGEEKGEEAEGKESRAHVDIRSWLNSMRGGDDGWGNQFGDAFDEVGLEDTSDFADLDEEIIADLTTQLKDAGASTEAVDSVMSAILSLRAG